jgi:UDP-GlcNAc:undecaprenyl-phosphate GlcNAc-1-phosphate transferase
VVGVVVVLSPRARRAAIAAREAELAALKERSRAAHPASRTARCGGPAVPPAPAASPVGGPVTGPVPSGRTAGVRR